MPQQLTAIQKVVQRLDQMGKDSHLQSEIELDDRGEPTGYVRVRGGIWDDVTDLADYALSIIPKVKETEDDHT